MEKYKITYTSAQPGYCNYAETKTGELADIKDYAWQEVRYPYHVGIEDRYGNLLCYREFWRNPNGIFGWDEWRTVYYKD